MVMMIEQRLMLIEKCLWLVVLVQQLLILVDAHLGYEGDALLRGLLMAHFRTFIWMTVIVVDVDGDEIFVRHMGMTTFRIILN